MSDTEAFSKFEEEFGAMSGALARKIASIPLTDGKDAVAQALTDADSDVADMANSISAIETELRHYPYNAKARAQATLKDLTAKFDGQKQELAKLKPGAAKPKFRNEQEAREWRDQRSRLLAGKEIIDDTSASLDSTARVIEETAGVGAATSQQLVHQREQFISARETIRETDDVLDRSRKLLLRMRRRVVTNKLITAFIILVELALCALIIYLKYYK
jgi:hypothetical protein